MCLYLGSSEWYSMRFSSEHRLYIETRVGRFKVVMKMLSFVILSLFLYHWQG